MLQAMATPKLMGIEIIGDYQDLRKLYESIQTVIEFKDKYVSAKYSTDVSDQLRSLNYEIRHAYQWDYESIELENGSGTVRSKIQDCLKQRCDDNEKMRKSHESGNLYYKVKIPYIEAIGYMIILADILKEIRSAEWVQKLELHCIAPLRVCWATVALFVAALDQTIEMSLEEFTISEILCRSMKNGFKKFDFRYFELINSFYLTKCVNLSIKEKKEMLCTLFFLLMRFPKSDATHNSLFIEMLLMIPDYKHFARYMKTKADSSEDGEVYMDEIFGLVDWKGMDW